MLNDELLTDEQKKIFRLELAIKKFKEYDEKRKKHIQNLENRIKSLEDEVKTRDEQIAMMENGGLFKGLRELQESNTNLRNANRHLQALLNVAKYYDEAKTLGDPTELQRALSLKEKNKALRKRIKTLKANYDLIISQR